MRVHCLADRFWLSATFAAPNDAAALVDDADRGGLKQHIKADVVLLIHGNASERWLPAEATGQSAPDPRRDYAMSRYRRRAWRAGPCHAAPSGQPTRRWGRGKAVLDAAASGWFRAGA